MTSEKIKLTSVDIFIPFSAIFVSFRWLCAISSMDFKAEMLEWMSLPVCQRNTVFNYQQSLSSTIYKYHQCNQIFWKCSISGTRGSSLGKINNIFVFSFKLIQIGIFWQHNGSESGTGEVSSNSYIPFSFAKMPSLLPFPQLWVKQQSKLGFLALGGGNQSKRKKNYGIQTG